MLANVHPSRPLSAQFKCKMDTALQKLMHAYCNRQGVSMNAVRFVFDGNVINEPDTPLDLDMEDGDVIDVDLAANGNDGDGDGDDDDDNDDGDDDQ